MAAIMHDDNREIRGGVLSTAIPVRFRITSHNIDAALRYRAVLALLADRWRPDLRVLEVGSGSGGAAEWLDHEIIGVDTSFERTAERGRRNLVETPGSVMDIPLPDGSFDAVLCVEMLEHIAAEERPRAIKELVRVLAPGGRLILTFPSGAEARKLDRWLADAYEARQGKPHPWATEHLALGIPDADEIAHLARATGADVDVHSNAWGPGWRFMHDLYTVGHGLPFTWPLFRRPFVSIAYHVLARLNRAPSYRAIIVIDRP
jgi:SAM-dependent methyltransferase